MPSILAEMRADPRACITMHNLGGVVTINQYWQFMQQLSRRGQMGVPGRRRVTPIAGDISTAIAPDTQTKIAVEPPVAGDLDSGLRYLPFNQNDCWFTQLTGNASVFVTDELSGCNVYVYGDLQNPWVCHCNSNENHDDLAANEAAKQASAAAAMAGVGVHGAPLGSFTRPEYRDLGYIGAFFVGSKIGASWQFFGCLRFADGHHQFFPIPPL